jgi:hypothetical protein
MPCSTVQREDTTSASVSPNALVVLERVKLSGVANVATATIPVQFFA